MGGLVYFCVQLESRFRLLSLVVALWLGSLHSAVAEDMALVDVFDQLRQQGHDILYSSQLVSPEHRVSIDDLTLSGLRKALEGSALELKRVHSVWVIGKLAAHVDETPLAADIA